MEPRSATVIWQFTRNSTIILFFLLTYMYTFLNTHFVSIPRQDSSAVVL